MKVLLDTHILLWWLMDDPKLPHDARDIILQPGTRVVVSAISVWEVAIKAALGRIEIDVQDMLAQIPASGFETLSFTAIHAARISTLPDIHRDPFDRALVAQSLLESLRLLTADGVLAGYAGTVMVVGDRLPTVTKT